MQPSAAAPALHWQAAEGSGLVSIAAVGLAKAQLRVSAPGGGSSSTPAHMQQPPGEQSQIGRQGEGSSNAKFGNAADLALSLEWALSSGGAGARPDLAGTALTTGSVGVARAGGPALHCSMSTEPHVPAAVLHPLEAMAGKRR